MEKITPVTLKIDKRIEELIEKLWILLSIKKKLYSQLTEEEIREVLNK